VTGGSRSILTLRIRDVREATPRARLATIALEQHRFQYRAGQALLVAMHGHERRRPYSIATAPDDAYRQGNLELLIGVDGQGNQGAHLTLQPNALVDVEGPVGGFVLPENPADRRLVFIAGGTGIAPLRAMLRQALSVARTQISVVYSARTSEEFAFGAELSELARNGQIDLQQTVTRPSPHGEWGGKVGRIGRDHLEHLVDGHSTVFFVCGPTPLVIEIRRLLEELHVPDECVRTEDWLRSHQRACRGGVSNQGPA